MSRGVNCMAGCRLEVKMKRLQAVAAAGAAGRVPGVATPPACALTPPPSPGFCPGPAPLPLSGALGRWGHTRPQEGLRLLLPASF